MTSSSSMIRTFAIRRHDSGRLRTCPGPQAGERLVTGWCPKRTVQVSDTVSDTWIVPNGLALRLGVRVRVLALVLIRRDDVHEIDDLAADDLRASALGSQDPRFVAAEPTAKEVDVAVR